MNRLNKTEAYLIRIKPYALALALMWSAIVAASLVWNVYKARQGTLDVARIQARYSFMKDVVYRRWNAGHGGVYVPVTKQTPPNPYLEVPQRDIAIHSGIVLTLMNPAYMTRQVHELAAKAYGMLGHITSLNPIRPANAPDPWEAQALQAFQRGAEEDSGVEEIKGEAYMRLMRPLVTEKSCLICHAAQGYKVGDIRGGISVSVPMSPLWAVERSQMLTLSLGHGLLWLVGLVGLGLGTRRLSKQIAGRKKAEDALQESKERLQLSIEKMPIAYIMLDKQWRALEWNEAAKDVFGYTEDEILGKSVVDYIVPEESRHLVASLMDEFMKGKSVHYSERNNNIRKDGTLISCRWHNTPLVGQDGEVFAILSMAEDVTDQKLAEEKIKSSLKEKEVLLSEIHHRVKNNMQVIISLLSLQADKIEDKKCADMLKENQNRILSMALIHEQLYLSKDFANIDFGEYIKILTNGLLTSSGVNTNKIRLNIEVKDVFFDIENAIPCGLIINELVSNSLKHAFPQGKEGEISITLRSTNENEFELSVSDNGIGISEDLDIEQTGTMGLQLVKVIAENQLDGKIDLDRTGGTRFNIKFKRTAHKPRT